MASASHRSAAPPGRGAERSAPRRRQEHARGHAFQCTPALPSRGGNVDERVNCRARRTSHRAIASDGATEASERPEESIRELQLIVESFHADTLVEPVSARVRWNVGIDEVARDAENRKAG